MQMYIHEVYDYVNTDRKIDLEGEDLPQECIQEIMEQVIEI